MTTARREDIAKVLFDACPVSSLSCTKPWADLYERERGYWCALADAVLPLLASAPEGDVAAAVERLRKCLAAIGDGYSCSEHAADLSADLALVVTTMQQQEARADANWDMIGEELAENMKLFGLLGVMPEIEAGRAGSDAVVDAITRLLAQLAAATTRADLFEKQSRQPIVGNLAVDCIARGCAYQDYFDRCIEADDELEQLAEVAERTAAIGHALLSQIHAALGLDAAVSALGSEG